MANDLELRRVHAGLLLDFQRLRHLTERRTAELLTAEGLDVTPAQANVLLALVQNRAPMTARQLARDLRVSDVTIGRFLKALERDGWIARKPDPTDARARLVSPTVKARAALPGFIRVSNAIADQAFAGFDRETVLEMGRVTGRIRDNLSR